MNPSLPAFWAVIPAAGVGARMAADRPKQYLQLGGRTILEHSLGCFLDHPCLKGLVVSLAVDDPYWPNLACAGDKRIQRVDGGAERSGSVLNALLHLHALGADDEDWVLVHDAARPNLSLMIWTSCWLNWLTIRSAGAKLNWLRLGSTVCHFISFSGVTPLNSVTHVFVYAASPRCPWETAAPK